MAHPALGIDCPTCIAKVGELCITVKLDETKTRSPHGKRIEQAKGQGLGKYDLPENPAEEEVHEYPADYKGPWAGDWVLYRDPIAQTAGHTGRVLRSTHGVNSTVTVKLEIPIEGEDTIMLERRYCEGWWPGEWTSDRTHKNMKKVE